MLQALCHAAEGCNVLNLVPLRALDCSHVVRESRMAHLKWCALRRAS